MTNKNRCWIRWPKRSLCCLNEPAGSYLLTIDEYRLSLGRHGDRPGLAHNLEEALATADLMTQPAYHPVPFALVCLLKPPLARN